MWAPVPAAPISAAALAGRCGRRHEEAEFEDETEKERLREPIKLSASARQTRRAEGEKEK